jgi:dienelactone hydrolase
VAATLRLPMLVLQGERDYQVTMTDFAAWKQALGGRPSVMLKTYPALNHLFVAGSGPSLPAEYAARAHVDAAVIGDIADWIRAAPPAPRP